MTLHLNVNGIPFFKNQINFTKQIPGSLREYKEWNIAKQEIIRTIVPIPASVLSWYYYFYGELSESAIIMNHVNGL